MFKYELNAVMEQKLLLKLTIFTGIVHFMKSIVTGAAPRFSSSGPPPTLCAALAGLPDLACG